MKYKKYNLSLSSLYKEDNISEGYGRLRGRANYVDPQGKACQIDMQNYENVRQFIFNVGQYGSPEDHKKVMGVLANTFPVKIFSSIEEVLADKKVFHSLFGTSSEPGVLLDLATLGMTAMECQLLKFGLEQMSKMLNMFTDFKTMTGQRKAEKDQEIKDKQKKLTASGALTLPAVIKPNQAHFLLNTEEDEKISKVKRELKIEEFVFKNKFKFINDPDVDARLLHFENFFGHYYENDEWDADKLQEDIDIIMDIARKIKGMSSTSRLVDIYNIFINEIDISSNPTNVKILDELEAETKLSQTGSEGFEKKFLAMLFSPNVKNDSFFYGRIISLLSKNRDLQRSFSSDIKSKINLMSRNIQSLIS